jgi:hypothetical protein
MKRNCLVLSLLIVFAGGNLSGRALAGKHSRAGAAVDALSYCGFLGTGGSASGVALAVDGAGCAYVAWNETRWEDPGWSRFAYVAKVRADGGELVYQTVVGDQLTISAIAVDASGRAFVTGSADENVVLAAGGGLDPTYNGGESDAFAARLSSAGAVEYAGLIGGSGADRGLAIAVGADGCAYVTGSTTSDDSTFPVRVGPRLTAPSGTYVPAFVAKVDAAGSALVYCGYLEGSRGTGIAVDPEGDAFVFTGYDIHRVAADGASLVGRIDAGCMGYDDWERPAACFAMDRDGGFYVVTTEDFIAPPGGGTHIEESRVHKISPPADDPFGCHVVYRTYIFGGTAKSIAVDGQGRLFVVGSADGDPGLSTLFGPGLACAGFSDAFIAKLDAQGKILYCGYLGGADDDYGAGVAVDATGSAYLTGQARSSAATFPVKTGPALVRTGDAGAFVAKLIDVHAVRFLAGAGGSLRGEMAQLVRHGGSTSPVTAVAAFGYGFLEWNGSGGFHSTVNPLKIDSVEADLEITAGFAGITLALEGERKTARSWLLRRPYAEIDLTVDNPAAVAVTCFALLLRGGDGLYSQLGEYSAARLENGAMTVYDRSFSGPEPRIYRFEARDAEGRTLAATDDLFL